ncbi:regulator of G-protein signaling 6 isoform X1 [Corvus hawaiiensis]|uniref:regulator of G-protein signaling 6 isoform X1 n=1 Tax=Corvus hawaiiensis TaxID=134902 RepID=UPI002018C75D|nr:regulator of G-protein signaling 6 isoform X1 [Corvus hawaiiensis]XP_048164488.1 regulator of G-protein signaling 6 isoform X1 [Corvus hawaiiensis]XP_048164493.1 regulator of G-protein signaling 6 isoform X1 [Corvus hawaiiensis]XP_048164494.1 regulator of G-protein signaling 6 isoform X1 [Corvus hawaiiensis]
MAQAPTDPSSAETADPEESSPNMIVYRKIEDIVTRMQDDKTGGVPIRTVKSFLSKIPSVVTGSDIVQWLMKNLNIEDAGEAIHLGSLIAAQGYVFPISDHVLTLKDDGTFYRFQAPYFWPSNCWEPENTDYAIYLCKRTMQNKARLELADYEAENLARLQRAFARKWEFIFMQAEAQVKIDRKKDKTERKILDSQERAFWDVHRPVPGCVNTTEMDIRKCRRMKNPQKVKKSVYGVTEESQPQSPVHLPSQPVRKTTKEDFRKQITFLNMQIERHCLKMSKVAESLIAYTEQYVEYDPFITPAEPSNPWISDDAALWDIEMSKEPSQQRVKRWGFSMDEVLKDPVGRDQFLRFLESEFSSENLRFWLAVQDLKKQPLQDVTTRVEEIWQEFLAPGAQSAINLDSHSYEKTSQNVKDPGRYTYEDAQEHIYKLMKSDSYARFLRSNAYQDLLLAKKKPENEQGRRTSLEKFTRSVGEELHNLGEAKGVCCPGPLVKLSPSDGRTCQLQTKPASARECSTGLRKAKMQMPDFWLDVGVCGKRFSCVFPASLKP